MARAAFWISFLSILSKILGFGREMALAAVFGASYQMDAYLVAMVIPTVLFANFFGTLRTTTIPVYTRVLNKDRGEARQLAGALLRSAGLLSLVGAALGLLLAPVLVRLLAPSFSGEVYLLTVQLSRWMMPAVPFLALAAVATPLLHAHNSFLLPAAIGFPYNAILIAATLYLGARYGTTAVAAALVAAVFSQFLLQWPALLRQGIIRRGAQARPLSHPGVKEIAILTAPVLLGLIGGEINLIVDRILASGLPEGSISALNFANRLNGMPFGLFGASLLTVFYPQLTRLAAAGNLEEFKYSLKRAATALLFLLAPMTAGFIILRVPIVQVLFQRGAFDARATAMTASALLYYSLGLGAAGLSNLLVRAFYSLHDTRTPVLITFVTVGLNVVLNLLLIRVLAHAGLALATSLAATVGMMLQFFFLRQKIGGLQVRRFGRDAGRILGATLAMGAVVWSTHHLLTPLWDAAGALYRAGLLFMLIALGALVYFLLSYLFGVEEMHYATVVLRKKLGFAGSIK